MSKICAECRHYKSDGVCARDDLKTIDIVTGIPSWPYARAERQDGRCGPSGNCWERKPPRSKAVRISAVAIVWAALLFWWGWEFGLWP